VRTLKPGQRVKLTLMRDGHARDVMLTVGERPRLPTDLAE
jgi:S1-C subfamily serine protease